ncbi:MAG: deoxycytidylate deaminase, partial [Pseudomonas sp.]
MSNTADAKRPSAPVSQGSDKDIVDRINSRQSEEIVVAFSGAVGCNLSEVVRSVNTYFEEHGYT